MENNEQVDWIVFFKALGNIPPIDKIINNEDENEGGGMFSENWYDMADDKHDDFD